MEVQKNIKKEQKELLLIDKAKISEIKMLKDTNLFIIYSGSYDNQPVFLYKMKNYEYNEIQFNNIIYNTNYLKIKAKFLLNKVGYYIEKNSKNVVMVYKSDKGRIIDFTDFKGIKKLSFTKMIIEIINKLKKADINLSTIYPELFIINNNEILLVDFIFMQLFDNIKDPFIKISLGRFGETKNIDILMMIPFLTKVFSDNEIQYNLLLNKYYKLFLNEIDFEQSSFISYLNDHVNDDKVQQFIKIQIKYYFTAENKQRYEKKENSLKDNFKQFNNSFYEMFDKLIKDIKCDKCGKELNKDDLSCYICDTNIINKKKKKNKNSKININDNSKNNNNYVFEENYINLVKKYESIIINSNNIKRNINQNLKIKENFTLVRNNIENDVKQIEKFKIFVGKSFCKLKELFELYKLWQQCSIKQEFDNAEDNMQSYVNDDKNLKENINKFEEIIYNLKKNCFNINNKNIKNIDVLLSILKKQNKKCLEYINNLKDKSNSLSIETQHTIEKYYTDIQNMFSNFNYLLENIENKSNNSNEFLIPLANQNKIERIFNIQSENEFSSEIIEIDFITKNTKHKAFPFNSKWLKMNNIIFVTGGIDEEEVETLNTNLLVDLNNLAIKEKCKMNVKRHSHCMVSIQNYYVLVIGGYEERSCELYSILEDKWKSFPNINYKRSNANCIILNEFELFLFGGKENDITNTIEWLNIPKSMKNLKRNSWKTAQLNENINLKSMMGVIKCKDRILLLGGINLENEDSQEETYSNLIYKFDNVNEKIIVLCKEATLPTPCYFLENEFIPVNNSNENNNEYIQIGHLNNNLISVKINLNNI
jgi:hypothetical protein